MSPAGFFYQQDCSQTSWDGLGPIKGLFRILLFTDESVSLGLHTLRTDEGLALRKLGNMHGPFRVSWSTDEFLLPGPYASKAVCELWLSGAAAQLEWDSSYRTVTEFDGLTSSTFQTMA